MKIMRKGILFLFIIIPILNVNAQVITKRVSKGIIENRKNHIIIFFH